MVKSYQKVIKNYQDDLLDCNHVVGVGYGLKEKSGKIVKEESIVVLVDKKLPREELTARDIVPQELGQYPTDVIEIGDLKFHDIRRKKMRPARPGVSIGHYKITAGTLGAIVKDYKTGQSLILSNNHVLANLSNGRDGRAFKGDPVLQPAKYDNGKESDDVIGYLERYVPIKKDATKKRPCPIANNIEKIINIFLKLIKPDYILKLQKEKVKNIVDCAVARPENINDLGTDIIDIGKIKGISEAKNGIKVKKSGRSTGLTTGTIRTVNTTVEIKMSETDVAIFENQFLTSPMSKPGDSGSLVLNDNNEVVGLLFAGSQRATVCNDIHIVMETLDIEF